MKNNDACIAHQKYRDVSLCHRCTKMDFNDNDEDFCTVGNYGRDPCPDHVYKPHCDGRDEEENDDAG